MLPHSILSPLPPILTVSQTLLAKNFVESGHRDIEPFKALEKTFDQEHRGNLPHAHFLRTYSHRIAAPQTPQKATEKAKAEKPLVPVQEEVSNISTKSSQSTASQATLVSTPKKVGDAVESALPKSDTKKKSKAEQLAERHPKRAKRTNGPPGNPPGTKEAKIAARMSGQLPYEASRLGSSNGKMVLFVSESAETHRG